MLFLMKTRKTYIKPSNFHSEYKILTNLILFRYPIDHGPIAEGEDWTEKFRRVITERLGVAPDDIRFALMAVVPDRRKAILKRLTMLRANKTIVTEVMSKLKKLIFICSY